MTRRLVLVIVATVAATLLLVGGTTLVFATLQARSRTEADLKELAASINEGLAQSGQTTAGVRPLALTAFRRALRLDGIELMTVTRGGRLLGNRPEGVPASALDPTALAAGTTESGRSGSLVWVADPVEARNRTVVTVVTRHTGSGLAESAGWFLLASLLTLAIGAAVAVVVGRRLGRPVRQADDAARRIAAGELSTRLTPPRGRPGDELVDLAHAINTMAESLERSRTLEQQFLLSVSHDLRTPLTSILGMAVTLRRDDLELPPDDRRDLAERIARNARKLDRLVSDLLDFERIDRGVLGIDRRPIDVGELARDVVEDIYLGGHNLSIDADPVVAWVDAVKVERIVDNLVVNAVRHTPEGTDVWLRVHAHDGGVLISVEDTGPGVPFGERITIFRPFEHFDEDPSAPGLGIGLSLVAGFAELHGGRAWVEERNGGGAAFKVFIPEPS
jgi:signal transduction histidine kinase